MKKNREDYICILSDLSVVDIGVWEWDTDEEIQQLWEENWTKYFYKYWKTDTTLLTMCPDWMLCEYTAYFDDYLNKTSWKDFGYITIGLNFSKDEKEETSIKELYELIEKNPKSELLNWIKYQLEKAIENAEESK